MKVHIFRIFSIFNNSQMAKSQEPRVLDSWRPDGGLAALRPLGPRAAPHRPRPLRRQARAGQLSLAEAGSRDL